MNSNKIFNLNLKSKIIISFTFYLILILTVVMFIIIPRIKFIKEVGGEITRQKQFLEEQYRNSKNLKEVNKNFEFISLNTEKLDKVFIYYDEDLQFIQSLEKVAFDNNVKQKISLDTKSEEERGDKECDNVKLELTVNGSFFNIMNYLIDLEAINYYVNVDFLNITKFSQSKDKSRKSDKTLISDFNNKLIIFDDLDIDSSSEIDSSQVMCKITASTYWK